VTSAAIPQWETKRALGLFDYRYNVVYQLKILFEWEEYVLPCLIELMNGQSMTSQTDLGGSASSGGIYTHGEQS
jgi:hypothetical protein